MAVVGIGLDLYGVAAEQEACLPYLLRCWNGNKSVTGHVRLVKAMHISQ